MSAALSLLSEGQIWTPVSHNTRTAGSGVTLPFYVIFKGLGAWNAIVPIKQNIIVTLPSTAKLTSRLTSFILKPNKTNFAPTPSNARATTRQTLTLVCSGTITSTKNGMPRNTRNSERPGPSQFAQLWVATVNDYQEHQDLLTEHAKEQPYCQHDPRNSLWVQYFVYSRTILVNYSFYSELKK